MSADMMGAYAATNTDESGYNGNWTEAQVYIALGNVLHTLARLGIDATPIEGAGKALIGEKLKRS
ncbi:hypothetical protein HER31_18355 [Ferrimonas lipolytica]|uniref:Uncharacterized protein n=1 Tax=Ferrimonas lipolytica TaxID=2724191 RepID=A0A6H1UJ84_9GAMM|nr:hypothetical protein [Ferrimonas lipolytica]QIZ78689.1 hypothetical protein HER31_18355 [Ferrimonas lipolytica]